MNQGIRRQQVPKKRKKVEHFYDYSLLFYIIFLTVFGLVMIYSISSYSTQLSYKDNGVYFMERQAGTTTMEPVAMIIISKMDYHIFVRFSVLVYLMSHISMITVSFMGREVNDKERRLAIGPLSFWPMEFVKITLIIMLVTMITIMGTKISKWHNMGYMVAMTLPITGLVVMNNLNSGIIVCGITFVMLLVAYKAKWPFFTIGTLGLDTLAFAGPIGRFPTTIKLLQPYQFRRIEMWLNPESDPTDRGFQAFQGLYVIGFGGLVGQGLGESIQRLGFLPESQSDMISATIYEELGLFGAMSIILIFLFIIHRFMLIASNAPGLFGALLVVGVMGHIATQVTLNITVVASTIPNTGIILPSTSHGGTSVLFLLVGVGIVLSVSNQIRLEK